MYGKSRIRVSRGRHRNTPGMGKELAEKYPAARAVFDEADKALGFSDLEDVL